MPGPPRAKSLPGRRSPQSVRVLTTAREGESGGSDDSYPLRAPCDEAFSRATVLNPPDAAVCVAFAQPRVAYSGRARLSGVRRSSARSTATSTTRRRFLTAFGAGTVGTVAGCSASPPRSSERTVTPPPTAAPSETSVPGPNRGAFATDGTPVPVEERDQLGEWGLPTTICEAEVVEDVGIRAIVDPAYAADWTDVDIDRKYRMGFEVGDGLTADSYVVGVTSADGTRARAYPLSVVWWHEAVNDRFDGPLLVTYCPICQSGMVAERRVAGAETTFGVSGQLWQPPRVYAETAKVDGRVFGASATEGAVEARNSGNLVLYDEATRSYWSQLLARAICGEREGDRLKIVPSAVATWGVWRDEHPETDVLLPPPYSTVT